MTVKDPQVVTPGPAGTGAPPLEAGDRLTRAEFHRRYRLHPEIKKADPIDGMVYMPSPERYRQHDQPQSQVVTWLGVYTAATPGVRTGVSPTVFLGPDDEVQPDALLFFDPAYGGQLRRTRDDYLAGAPELVVEVAASSASYDLHVKLRAYLRAGVKEYLVVVTYDPQVRWLRSDGGAFRQLEPDGDGVVRSEAFPGLWLQPGALLAGDLTAVLATVSAGLEREDHARFAAELARRRGQDPPPPPRDAV
jgi:Uma2 family endonuclease